MRKNISILAALILSVLCVVGFQQGTERQYRVVKCEKTDANSLQNRINENTRGQWEGWEFHSTIIIPPDGNFTLSRCSLVFIRGE